MRFEAKTPLRWILALSLGLLIGCPGGSGDPDGDGIVSSRDNCPAVANPDQTNTDNDLRGDACDTDPEGDNVLTERDNCPMTPNPDQADSDGDGIGDACDASNDRDADGVDDGADNCPDDSNADQANQDGDALGDVCDDDIDGDGANNDADNCPLAANPDQADADGDSEGDVCDDDRDGDMQPNDSDNCPDTANSDQADADADGIGDACDTAPPPPEFSACTDDLPADADDIDRYQCRWEHRALDQQRFLDRDLPLREVLFLSSHNSYNSTAYPLASPSSQQDPNHSRTMFDQLRLDMRSVELDIHWFNHAESGGPAPILCHGRGASQAHFGCSPEDRHVREGLQEISDFMRSSENLDRVLIIDIEDSLADFVFPSGAADVPEGHDETIAEIDAIIGDLVYKTADRGLDQSACHSKPMDLTINEMLAAGKRILITGPCNGDAAREGTAWRQWVFDLGGVRVQKANDGFDDYPDCESSSFSFDDYRQRWVRLWEDTTNVGAATNSSLQRIDSPTTINMLKCGVNAPSYDQLTGDDSRFAAMVWSWAEDQPPETGPGNDDDLDCASHNSDGKFEASNCSTALPYACFDAANQIWSITTAQGAFAQGEAVCNSETAGNRVFATPASGYLNQLLRETKTALGVERVWLNYSDLAVEGEWRPN